MPKSRYTKPRCLTPEEQKLWEQVTRHDKKLHPRVEGEEAPSLPDSQEPAVAPMSEETKAALLAAHEKRKGAYRKPVAKAQGDYANIDKNTAERFRKGNTPIDATLDLHGMTAARAHAALVRFVDAQYKRQSRCLLIITGKGKTGEGVLRSSLPGWLGAEELSPMILAFDRAQAKHGGSGAFYVLLRRKR